MQKGDLRAVLTATDCRKAQAPAAPYDMTGWYRRWENNGWRPIADRLFIDPEAAVKQEKADAYRHWFHFCPKVRRQQRQAAVKQRKRLWMSKVYRCVSCDVITSA